ncbi:MAG: type II toxin-antitoxin system Phd/YefM family antitoxin [Clostridia bacterium]|nr:type II toxin-antitoxin system Phd/YefM family antitoxin [Clostridia bacterium]
MDITTDKIVSISEANQNFSKTARLADKLGEVFIFKNNRPKYRLVVIDEDESVMPSEPEDGAEEMSEKKVARILGVLKKYRKGFEELLRISEK